MTAKEARGWEPIQDPVEHPPHYTQGPCETIEWIQASLTHEEYIGYLRGCIIKYQSRANMKGGEEDLRKAGVYQRWLEEALEE